MMNTNISGNIDGVLSRSEMKKIMAGSGPTCECSFETDSGTCDVYFYQFSGHWSFTSSCGASGNGQGQYTGSLCGGGCPSTELEVN